MKKISVFLCSILLSSCIAVGSESIRNIDTVRENMSYYGLNKQSIESMFGMPASSFERDGKNVYEYNYIAVYTRKKDRRNVLLQEEQRPADDGHQEAF